MSKLPILVATSNPHKLEEIRAIFTHQAEEKTKAGPERSEGPDLSVTHAISAFTLLSLADINLDIEEPVEDADTFAGNALLKSQYYANAAAMLCLADDSGLCVDALQGAPGILSARYADATGPRPAIDTANNIKLLKELGDTPAEKRTANFTCAMALCAPKSQTGGAADHLPIVVEGYNHGRILTADQADDPEHPERGRGENGFGYDPLFLREDLCLTMAQMSADIKNSISHRHDAAIKMLGKLLELADQL